jgi:hypothetical protein
MDKTLGPVTFAQEAKLKLLINTTRKGFGDGA